MTKNYMCFAVAMAVCLVSPAWAKPPLGERPQVVEGLIIAGIAYEIGDVCPDLDVRMLRGLSYLMRLKDVARDLGYSSAEIDAFIDSREEKNRLETVGRNRLFGLGAIEGQPSTYCVVGRQQIAANTPVGQLLHD